jgi:hypothetical protein
MTQAITAVYLARRNPRLARGAFPARWRRHGALALSFSFMDACTGYFHNDVQADPPRDADPYTAALWTDDYDGVGVVAFPNGGVLEDQFNDPEFPILLADEWGAFNEPVAHFAAMTHETVHKTHIGTAVKFFQFLRARDGVNGDAFAARWLAHVSQVMSSPELAPLILRYVHYTPMATTETGDDDPKLRERLDIGLKVAGIAELGFASRADLEAYLAHPEREAVSRDLYGFADPERSLTVLTNEVTMKAPAALR